MRFMIIRKADPQTEAWAMPSKALVRAMMAYDEEMIRAGVMLGGDGNVESDRSGDSGARVRRSVSSEGLTPTDGRCI